LVSLDSPDLREMMACPERSVFPDPQANQEQQVTLEPAACQGSLDLQDTLALPVFQAHRDHLDHLEMMVPMEKTAYLAHLESRGHSDHTARLDHLETLALPGLLDPREKSDPKAHVEKRGCKAHSVSGDQVDLQDHGESLARLVCLDLLVFLEQLVRLAILVLTGHLEREDLLDHLETTVPEVCLARRESRDHVATRETREIGETQAHLGHADMSVFLDLLAPRAPGEILVSLDEMAIQAPLALRDCRDHGDRREIRA
jgi:hypothetical protein